MWISLDKTLLDMARIDPPLHDFQRHVWSIAIYDTGCKGWQVDYSTPAAADMAFLKARQFILRGKTDEGNNLLVWPMERMASDMAPEALDAMAKQTQGAGCVTFTEDERPDIEWKLNGLP